MWGGSYLASTYLAGYLGRAALPLGKLAGEYQAIELPRCLPAVSIALGEQSGMEVPGFGGAPLELLPYQPAAEIYRMGTACERPPGAYQARELLRALPAFERADDGQPSTLGMGQEVAGRRLAVERPATGPTLPASRPRDVSREAHQVVENLRIYSPG